MNFKTVILSFGAALALLIGFTNSKKIIPSLGMIAPLEQDSILYASGFKMLGESVGKMLSPSLTAAQFQQNLVRIKNAKCKVLLCNIFFPGGLKIAGPDVNQSQVLASAPGKLQRPYIYRRKHQ